jgi:hypothetical protein
MDIEPCASPWRLMHDPVFPMEGPFMITRRSLLFTATSGLLAAISVGALAAPIANDPLAIVNAIYTRVVSGNGDLGGAFMLNEKPKYFSKSLIRLWAKSDVRSAGEQGPLDFDPATNSQDPSVKSFTATAEKIDAGTATIAVKLQRDHEVPRKHADDDVLRYDFVRDGGHWKIDDIRGASDAKPWSMREKFNFSLRQ